LLKFPASRPVSRTVRRFRNGSPELSRNNRKCFQYCFPAKPE
jgi:hypothetical protein